MTNLAGRIMRITTDLDCGLGDLDAVKCRLRDTLDVLGDIALRIEGAQAAIAGVHARVEGSYETVCGHEVTPDATCFTYFTQGKRDVCALNSVDCPACREYVLRWPEYHMEWERAASAHAKAKPREPQRRAYATELDGWRRWLCEQPIVNEVTQESLDDLARALASVRRAP